MVKLMIKNMVCPRCIQAVESLLISLGHPPVQVALGEATLKEQVLPDELPILKEKLSALGFELLDDQRKQQIERIKSVVIEQIHHRSDEKVIFSDLIAKTLGRDYSQLSKLFSATEGITIEHYIILQRTEKVKELLAYDQLTLSEIADKMGYSSVAHLSAQFRKTTGLTPTQFKSQGIRLRKPIDRVGSDQTV